LPAELGQWWTDFADADSEKRQAMLLPDHQPKKRRRRRSGRASSSGNPSTSES
jgi:poly(A) polymerase